MKQSAWPPGNPSNNDSMACCIPTSCPSAYSAERDGGMVLKKWLHRGPAHWTRTCQSHCRSGIHLMVVKRLAWLPPSTDGGRVPLLCPRADPDWRAKALVDHLVLLLHLASHLADILTKGSFTRNEWNHLPFFFQHILVAIWKVISLKPESFVIGALSKRGQDTTSSDGSSMAKVRPTGVSSQGSGFPVNQGNKCNKKRVCLVTGNRWSSSSNAEVGLEVPKCINKRWST